MNRQRVENRQKGTCRGDFDEQEALRVLVVEDNPVTRQLLNKLLTKSDYQVETATNGIDALNLFERSFYPIVITDWMMPEMDGLAFCRTLRSRENQNYVYIILLTARDSKDDIISGLRAGADDYLVKPIHPAELIARLNTAKRIVGLEQSLRKRNEEIALLSITDSLTQVFNRGYFNQQLPTEIKRAVRHQHHLSLVICDIDHFKAVNDRYGHQVGDSVLRQFAACLKATVRESVDWVARYGGEEFVVVLPETGLPGAREAAERYREVVSACDMVTEAGCIHITISLGVASLNPVEDPDKATMHNLVSVADQCLYQAKDEGRNRSIGRWVMNPDS